MNTNGYEEVNVCDSNEDRYTWKPFFRQFFVCSGVWIALFAYGLCIGAPTVFIPQIRKENNSTAFISDEMASWLSSAIYFGGLPCVFVLSILTNLIGRKICFFIACVDTFIAFTVFYCSNSVFQILISVIMQGLFSAAQIVISIVVLTEYTSPKYRGFFLTLKATMFYWGVWLSNIVGTFCHWKKIGLIGILCALYVSITVLMWPESPYWFASKGKYKECAASHRWLKGRGEESEKELKNLVNTQKEYSKNRKKTMSQKEAIQALFKDVTSKEFLKPVLISLLTGSLVVSSGKIVFIVYAIDILKKITENESVAYTGMLILDGITILSMFVGCFLTKFLNRRTLLFATSSIAAVILFSLSLYLYLISLSVIEMNHYVSVCLMILFSIAIGCGPLILSTSVYGELIPIRSRNVAVCLIAVIAKLILGINMKTTPYLLKIFGLHGLFLFYGINNCIVLILLYKYLPETKDKTLQEIADSMKCVKKNIVRVTEAENLVNNTDKPK